MLQIIKRRKLYLSIAAIVTLASWGCVAVWGIRPGIDFTGGSLVDAKFTQSMPAVTEVQSVIKDLKFDSEVVIQTTEDQSMILRYKSDETNESAVHAALISKLVEKYPDNFREDRYETVGPAFGRTLKTQAVYAIIFAILAIVIYIAWAFRKVSWPVQSWKYGVISILALLHDISLPLGLFAVLGHFYNVEVDLPFVAALLTILGYSINDTIVIFDRIRENLGRVHKTDFAEVVNRSVNETMARSINTILTVQLCLIAIFLFGGTSIKNFTLALIVGIASGAYSSIFIASPLLVVWERWGKK